MPTPDSRITPAKATYFRTPMMSKNLRILYEKRLNLSRNLFYLSRKQVDKLKRSYSVKRVRSVLKPADDSWLTSGNFGSRDCVLVFRTNILNVSTKQSKCLSSSTDVNDSIDPTAESSSNDTSTSLFGSGEHCMFNPTDIMSASLPSSSKSSKPFNTDFRVNDNTCRKSTKSLNTHSEQSSSNAKNFPFSNKLHVPVFKKSSNKSIKLLNDSFSSSDTSISSESDLEETMKKTITLDLQNNAYNVNNSDIQVEQDVGEALTGENEVEDDDNENNENDSVYMPGMPATELKITYKFISTETKLLRKIFVRHGLSEAERDENFSILWTGVHMKPDILRNLAPYQRVNHFPRSYELTRKDRLYKNIERMQHLRGHKHFDIIPQSFVLPVEYRDLVSAHNKHRGPWIVKPAASSRGRGIFIVTTPDQIPQDEQVLVSKYVADPLCIDGHKCDVRVYVLVTSFDPLIIYLYEEGLVRLATVKYDRTEDSLWNPCMHLCNYSINKYHSDYIKSNDAHDEDVGHKWTLSALLRHLKAQGCDTCTLMCNIEDLIIKSILASAQSIISACRMFVPSGSNCFELYGFDILIDDGLKPWLLEVNLSPSMGVDSPLDSKVKACLITDVLTCIGIPAYSASMRAHYDSKWTRFRGVNYSRRTNSAETAGSTNNGAKRNGTNQTTTPPTLPLTVEEQRIVRNARLQNARRGGFVRIFPTEDSMQRYGAFLDSATGIPLSTPVVQGQTFYSMILPHNYNQMLFSHLYGVYAKDLGVREDNSCDDRMSQYERALEGATTVRFEKKKVKPKCEMQGKLLKHKVLKQINAGSELTQLQARQTFSLYLESVLRRLTQEPRDYHEKLILKFVNRVGVGIKAPVFFRNPQNSRVISKAHSAMTAKLLGDFLEQYNRDTEAYVDSFDHFGMIPTALFNDFLAQAQEADLESVLVLCTNLTGTMPYLYNRCGLSVPPTPPIPSGVHGFLKALPAMVLGGAAARDLSNYIKINEKENPCAAAGNRRYSSTTKR